MRALAGGDVTSRTLVLGTSTYPVILPNTRDPRLHVAAVIITIHVLGQVGLGFHVSVPQILAAILTCAVLEVALTFRARRTFVWPAERDADRQRRGAHPARSGDAGRRLEHAQVVPVRRDRRLLAADEVRDPVPRHPPVQPVEHRPRRRLRRARERADRAARLLVGAAERLDGGGLRRHPRRRTADHGAAAPPRRRRDVLDRARRRCRRARRGGPLHHGALGVRPRVRLRLLAGDRHVAGGPDLPVLHDHGPQDGAGRAGRAGRVRAARRGRQHAADGAADRRVRDQGRPARRARRRLRGSSPHRPAGPRATIRRRPAGPVRRATGDGGPRPTQRRAPSSPGSG